MRPVLFGKVAGEALGKLTIVFLFMALLSGCKNNPRVEFTAEPDTIDKGQVTTLSWSVAYDEGATDVTVAIEPDVGVVDLIGAIDLTPVETTQYTLTTTATIEEVLKTTSKQVTVTVMPGPDLPIINDFSFYQSDTRAGEPVELNWTVSGADSITILPDSAITLDSDIKAVAYPVAATTYTLVAENQGGKVTAEVSVDVTFTDIDYSQIWPDALRQCVEQAVNDNGWQYSEQVTSVSCTNKKLDFVGGLHQFNNLYQLDLANNRIVDLSSFLNSMTRLEQLNLSDNNISELHGLQHISTLSHLDLSGNPLQKNAELDEMLNNNIGLVHLALNDIPLNDVYLDIALEKIESLEIENTGMRSLAFINSLTTLKALNVANNAILDLTHLSGFENIESLKLQGNFLKSLSGIEQLSTLTALDVSDNPNLELQDVATVINANIGIQHLGIAGVALMSLSELGGIFVSDGEKGPLDFTLLSLNIDSTQISDIKEVVNQPSLRTLSFQNNVIDIFPDFSLLTQLTALNISNTGLSDYSVISPVANKLVSLGIANNPLAEAFLFSDYSSLIALDVSGLALGSTAGIELLVNLERLHIADNDLVIDSIAQSFPGLTKIRDLNLSGNKVTALLGEGAVLPLESLNLSNTGISSLDISHWKNLRALDISQNPNMFDGSVIGAGDVQLHSLNIAFTELSMQQFNVQTIRDLDLSYSAVDFQNLTMILEFAVSIESLKVSGLANSMYPFSFFAIANSIQDPRRLKLLDISGINQVASTDLLQFNNLRSLNISGVDFSQEPLSLLGLEALRQLDASSARLSFFEIHENIHELTLSDNPELIVSNLGSLNSLMHLDVSKNVALDIASIRLALDSSPKIESIKASGLGITNFSELFSEYFQGEHIKTLNLSENHLSSLMGISQFVNIRHLDVRKTLIENLSFISEFSYLEYLDVGDTYSSVLPVIKNPKRLRYLNVANLPIAGTEALFPQVSAFSNLSHLNMSGINLREESLHWLESLPIVTLDLSNTNIIEANFENWNSLQVLDLSENLFGGTFSLPVSVRELYLNNSLGLNYLPHGIVGLKALDVSYTGLTFDDIYSAVADSAGLHTLGVAGLKAPSGFGIDEIIDVLSQTSQELKYLNVSDLEILSWDKLGQFEQLESLIAQNTQAYKTYTDMKNLVHLDISGEQYLDPYNLQMLFSNNPHLQILGLNNVDLSSLNIFSMLEQSNIQLRELLISETGVSNLVPHHHLVYGRLTRLDVSGNNFLELPNVLMVPSLRWLDISGNNITDISTLPSGLTYLDASSNPIDHFDNLNHLKWLRSLSLANTSLYNVYTLSELKYLQSLSLVGTSFDSALTFSDLKYLQSLDLSMATVAFPDLLLTAMGNLVHLRELRLAGLNVFGASGGYPSFDLDLPNLRVLDLSDTGLMDGQFDQYPSLRYLDVSNNPISHLWGNNLQLEYLDVSRTFLTSIPFPLENISSLFVSYSQMDIEHVMDAVQHINGLRSLGVAGLKRENDYWMSELQYGNEDLKQLEYIDVSDMGVYDISWAFNLEKLTVLKAANNFISYLGGGHIIGSEKLQKIDLSGNPIFFVNELESLLKNSPRLESIGLNGVSLGNLDLLNLLEQYNTVAIKELKLSGTGLQNWGVQEIAKYQSLERIELANNKLDYLPAFALSPALTFLDIHGNGISDITFLTDGSIPRNLMYLDVGDNPIDGSALIQALSVMSVKALGASGLTNMEGIQSWSGLAQLTYLDLSGAGLIEFDVSSMSNIRVLKLSDNYLDGLDLLNLSLLRELDLANNGLWYELAHMLPQGIQKLNLSNNPRLTSFEFIANLEFITELRLSGMRVDNSNLFSWQSPLNQKAHQIRVLDISNTDVADFYLIDFKYLKELNVSDTALYGPFYGVNPAFIEKLFIANIELNPDFSLQGYRLKALDLSGYSSGNLTGVLSGGVVEGLNSIALNNIGGGDVIAALSAVYPYSEQKKALRILELNNNGLSDLGVVSGFENLESLSLRNNHVSDILDLPVFQRLSTIDLYGNQVSDISPLHNLSGLRSLDIGGNTGFAASSVEGVLLNNPNITALGINGVNFNIGDIAFSVSPRLVSLDIGNTGIAQFNLDRPLLQSLNISENTFQQLPNIPLVKSLNVSNNSLSDISLLFYTEGLTHLDISNNSSVALSDLQTALSANPDLVSISLGGLALSSMSDLWIHFNGYPYPLRHLDLSNTGISDLFGIDQFTTLRTLDLSGNPGVDCPYLDSLSWPGLSIVRPSHCSM